MDKLVHSIFCLKGEEEIFICETEHASGNN